MRERQRVIRGDGDNESSLRGTPSRPEVGPSAPGHGQGRSDASPGDAMDACIRDLVAGAPPLTPAQRDRLALLFGRPGRRPPARTARDRQLGQPGTEGLPPPPDGRSSRVAGRPPRHRRRGGQYHRHGPGGSSPAASPAPRPAPAARAAQHHCSPAAVPAPGHYARVAPPAGPGIIPPGIRSRWPWSEFCL